MTGIVRVAALLTVLALSLLITRLATVALTHTGMSTQAARFQARSAFTGTGLTTSEAEQVVRHPVRRRIVMTLMVLRSAALAELDQRHADVGGEEAHHRAVQEQRHEISEERRRDRERRGPDEE